MIIGLVSRTGSGEDTVAANQTNEPHAMMSNPIIENDGTLEDLSVKSLNVMKNIQLIVKIL